MGNKILRQRLRGPALAAYYPRRIITFQDLQKEFAPDLMVEDEWEDDRQEKLEGYVALFRAHAVICCSWLGAKERTA